MTEMIGGVKMIMDFYTDEDYYSDGDIENDIIEIVKSEEDYDQAIARDERWPIFYHLTKQRELIVQPMQIQKNDRVLEIGAGCGALTGALAEQAMQVDCIELSKKRSLINAYRNEGRDNINIYLGNYQDIRLNNQYEVVVLIGVFEYATCYVSSNEPYVEFLRQVHRILKPGGRLYIAIENRFGLKYLAGCQEGHSGKEFDGVEGYPNGGSARTFTRNEIIDLLTCARFSDLYFYYPFPDYKIPSAIFSDDFLPELGMVKGKGVNYNGERHAYFDEDLVYNSLFKNDFRMFSNSFLIEAKVV